MGSSREIQDKPSSGSSSSYSKLISTGTKVITEGVFYPLGLFYSRCAAMIGTPTSDVIKQSISGDFKSVYKGILPDTSHKALCHAVKIFAQPAFFKAFHVWFNIPMNSHSGLSASFVNGLAAIPAAVLEMAFYPLSTLATRLQQQQFKAITSWRQSFQGGSVVFIKAGLGNAMLFGGMHFKNQHKEGRSTKERILDAVSASATGVTLSQAAKAPFDRVKKVAQANTDDVQKLLKSQLDAGQKAPEEIILTPRQALELILKYEGVKGLWKGFGWKLLAANCRQLPAMAVYLYYLSRVAENQPSLEKSALPEKPVDVAAPPVEEWNYPTCTP